MIANASLMGYRYRRRSFGSYSRFRRSFGRRGRFSRRRRGTFRRRSRMTRMPAYMRVKSPEAKYIDHKGTNSGEVMTFTAAAGFNLYTLNLTIEGVANFNRLGRRIRMKSIQITGAWQPFNASGGTGTFAEQPIFARFAVVYDRQPSPAGTPPTYNEIWMGRDASGTANNAANEPWSPPNVDNIDRFQVWRLKCL